MFYEPLSEIPQAEFILCVIIIKHASYGYILLQN